MNDGPIELDDRRGMAAQRATEIRRGLQKVQADRAALQTRQDELEAQLAAAPSTTWAEAAAKACFLLHLFAATSEAQDARRQKLIASVVDDLTRLGE